MSDYINSKIFEIFENSEQFTSKLLKDTAKKYIYHYTSDVALKSILESYILRLSDINFLNDEAEMKYFYDLAKNYIATQDKTNFYNKVLSVINNNIQNNFQSQLKVDKYKRKTQHFVVSFSLNSDCLPLWINYTKNPNNIGYNIKFKKSILTRALKNSKKYAFVAGAIIYDEKQQKKIIKKIFNFFQKLYDTYDRNNRHYVIHACTIAIKLLSLFCKSPCFKNEEEYRIVIKNRQIKSIKEKTGLDIKFKINNGIFIPYIELGFKQHKNCINGIMISPTQKNILASRGIQELLDEYDYENVFIEKSKIPLRY